jgi:hypothetical protein
VKEESGMKNDETNRSASTQKRNEAGKREKVAINGGARWRPSVSYCFIHPSSLLN